MRDQKAPQIAVSITDLRTLILHTNVDGPGLASIVTDDSVAAAGQPATRTFQFSVVASKPGICSVSASGLLSGRKHVQTHHAACTNG